MSDGVVADSVAQQPSAGTLLRQAREAAGLHVAALAVALKVPVRKLEALEQDRLDQLPDAVFTRALASSICRTLKIDPQEVLGRLPQSAAPRLVQDREGINAPFRAPGDAAGPTWRDLLTRPPVMVALALLVGAAVIVAWPLVQTEGRPAESVQSTVTMPAPMTPAALPEPQSTQAVPSAASSDAQANALASQTPVAPVATEVKATATAPQPQPLPAAKAEPEPESVPANSVLVFRAKASSWIKVTDARGAVALQRQLGAGESAGASGALPLSVTVGSASATEVSVRGKAFSLAPVTRDNVAKFEVK